MKAIADAAAGPRFHEARAHTRPRPQVTGGGSAVRRSMRSRSSRLGSHS